jgi:hypothetical protein
MVRALTIPQLKEPSPERTVPSIGTGSTIRNPTAHSTFEDVTEKAGLAGFGYSTGVAVGITTMMVLRIST